MNVFRTAGRRLDQLPRIKRINLPDEYESKWIQLSSGKTRYVLLGDVESEFTIVLAPDPPNSIEQMSPLISLLVPKYQVLIFDMLGFGYSSFNGSYDFSIDKHSAATEELLNSLNLNNVILAQTCVAALSGLKVANRHPELVRGVVLGQTPCLDQAKQWAAGVDFKGIMSIPLLGQVFLRLARSKVSKLWYQNAFPKGYESSAFYEHTSKSFRQGARFSLASAFQSLIQEQRLAEEFTVHQPAVMLWGKKDRSHRKTDPTETMELLTNGELIQLEDCGHFPDIEAPSEFAQAIDLVVKRV